MVISASKGDPDGSTGRPAAEQSVSDLGQRADASYGMRLAIAVQQAEIRLLAYYRAERRGFAPGHELDDWLAAEAEMSEIDAARNKQSQQKAQA